MQCFLDKVAEEDERRLCGKSILKGRVLQKPQIPTSLFAFFLDRQS